MHGKIVGKTFLGAFFGSLNCGMKTHLDAALEGYYEFSSLHLCARPSDFLHYVRAK